MISLHSAFLQRGPSYHVADQSFSSKRLQSKSETIRQQGCMVEMLEDCERKGKRTYHMCEDFTDVPIVTCIGKEDALVGVLLERPFQRLPKHKMQHADEYRSAQIFGLVRLI
jgi:hypothetical protein